MSGSEQAPLDILEDGELPEESMEVTQTVAVVPPTPAASRLCDGWGREQEKIVQTEQARQAKQDLTVHVQDRCRLAIKVCSSRSTGLAPAWRGIHIYIGTLRGHI